MKKLINTIVVIIIACTIYTSTYAEDMSDRGEFYPLLTVVVDKTHWTDNVYIIICEDSTGNLWCFFDEDNTWNIGDIANLLMWNMGGPIEEDEIVEIYWTGYTDNIEQFYQVMGWIQ